MVCGIREETVYQEGEIINMIKCNGGLRLFFNKDILHLPSNLDFVIHV